MPRPIDLEDIFGADADWEGRKLQGLSWLPDSSGFLYLADDPGGNGKSIYQRSIDDPTPRCLVAAGSLTANGEAIPINGFQASPDGSLFLVEGCSPTPRFEYVTPPPDRDYYLYDLHEDYLRPLSGISGWGRYAKISPDGKRVAFVRSGNIFVVDVESGLETQLTRDGGENVIYGENRGYDEDGWRWSPTGDRILFVRTDQRDVGSAPLVDYLSPYPTVHWLKYPKAGTANWRFRVGVIEVETGEITWPNLGSDTDVYFPRLQWMKDPDWFAVQRLNRLQTRLDLYFVNVDCDVRSILSETDPRWVRVDDDLIFLEHSDRFLWTSERSGYKHAYLYDLDGELINQVTRGDWEISAARAPSALLGVDEQAGRLFFKGKRVDPREDHLYSIGLDGSGLEGLSETPGWHDGSLSPDGKYIVATHSDTENPPSTSLRRNDWELLYTIDAGTLPALDELDMGRLEFLTIPLESGVELSAMMIKPTDFDPEKAYPVIFSSYGGISSQKVVDRWGGARGLWDRMMAGSGYIVVTLDNRGTGGRGKEFEAHMFHNIGTVPVVDHVEAASYLGQFSYVDDEMGFGIYGGSAGGLLASLALTRGSDVFRTGVAMASATNNWMYQSFWAERYLDMPQDNHDVYLRESVAPYAALLRGKLLLVHGMADDNVQLQTSIEVAEALQDAGKQFDMMYYHGREHRIAGGNTELHLYAMIRDYFFRHMPSERVGG